VSRPSQREENLRRFHAASPGITSRAFARGGSYERLAGLVAPGAAVLDLGCGDGYLVELLVDRGCRAIGLDLSPEELALARANVRRITCPELHRYVCGRAQALPLGDQALDVVVCHLAFMLFDELEQVVAELGRVLVPGGRFIAVLGGGPTAHGSDAFHRFLAIAGPQLRGLGPGDPRARTEAGWRALFATWSDVTFERHELDLSGSFDEVWEFLGASYELEHVDRDAIRDELRDQAPQGRVMCRAVIWIATATV